MYWSIQLVETWCWQIRASNRPQFKFLQPLHRWSLVINQAQLDWPRHESFLLQVNQRTQEKNIKTCNLLQINMKRMIRAQALDSKGLIVTDEKNKNKGHGSSYNKPCLFFEGKLHLNKTRTLQWWLLSLWMREDILGLEVTMGAATTCTWGLTWYKGWHGPKHVATPFHSHTT